MTEVEILKAVWFLTLTKMLLGAALGVVLLGSLYKFKKFIMTVFGILLLSNLIVLYLVMGIIEWN